MMTDPSPVLEPGPPSDGHTTDPAGSDSVAPGPGVPDTAARVGLWVMLAAGVLQPLSLLAWTWFSASPIDPLLPADWWALFLLPMLSQLLCPVLAGLTLWALAQRWRVLAPVGALLLLVASAALAFSWSWTSYSGPVAAGMPLIDLLTLVWPAAILCYVLLASLRPSGESSSPARWAPGARRAWALGLILPAAVVAVGLELGSLWLFSPRLVTVAALLVAGLIYAVLRRGRPELGSPDWVGVTLALALPSVPELVGALIRELPMQPMESSEPYTAPGAIGLAVVLLALVIRRCAQMGRAHRTATSVGG